MRVTNKKLALFWPVGDSRQKKAYFALDLRLWSFRVFGRFAFCGSGRFSLLYDRLCALIPVQVIWAKLEPTGQKRLEISLIFGLYPTVACGVMMTDIIMTDMLKQLICYIDWYVMMTYMLWWLICYIHWCYDAWYVMMTDMLWWLICHSDWYVITTDMS